MIPTRAQVKTRMRALLDDPTGATFTDAVFTESFGEAYDALFQAFLTHQCPRIQIIATYTLPLNTTSLTPATASITDMADIDELEERLSGSSDKYTRVEQVDKLPQRDQSDRLMEFVWRADTFYFVGATVARQLQITYESSGTAPTDDSASINVDGCLTFLAKAAAAAAGPRKGYDELAAKYMRDAYGPRYEQGVLGGELFRLIQPRVRQMQHVQIAPRPYGVTRNIVRRRAPYIQAQTNAMTFYSPIEPLDGVTTTFSFPGTPVFVVYNGAFLTPNNGFNFVTTTSIQLIDPLGNPIAPAATDSLRAQF